MQNTTGEIRTVERGHKYRIRVRLEPTPSNPNWHWSKMRTVEGNKTQANAALVEYKNELLEMQSDMPESVGEIVEQFQEYRKSLNKVSPLTIKRDQIQTNRIIEYLGHINVKDLNSIKIERAYVKMKKDGLSDSELHKTHVKLKQILRKAVNDGLIVRNPCDSIYGITKPKQDIDKRKISHLTKEQALALPKILREQEPTGKIVATWLAFSTCMRRGEVLALQWQDIDLEGKKIHIRHQYGAEHVLKAPKTTRSKRTISMDEVTKEFLIDWKSHQEKAFNKLLKKVDKTTPVCSDQTGDFIDPDNFSRWRRSFFIKIGFAKYAKEKPWKDSRGIRRVKHSGYIGPTFHALRHAQATLLVAGGVDPKTVQARLGHEQITTTLQIYAEALEENDEKAADYIESLIKV